jgi:hypothetical protein
VELDGNVYWYAVRGVTIADAIASVFGPHAQPRTPERSETLRKGGKGKPVYACFTKGDWTFFVAPRDTLRADPGWGEAFKLVWDATNGWSAIEHVVNGAIDWSVYGSQEDDHVRVEGDLPVVAAAFAQATEACELAPLQIGHALTGFRHDQHARPRGFQIIDVQPPRELILPDGQSILQPSVAQLEDGITALLAANGSSLLLVVDVGDAAKRMFAERVDGAIRIETLGPSGNRTPLPSSRRPLDALDVKRCFGDFFDEGELSDRYIWASSGT